MGEPEQKPAKVGKWLFYASVVFFFWVSWYSMAAHSPGFIH